MKSPEITAPFTLRTISPEIVESRPLPYGRMLAAGALAGMIAIDQGVARQARLRHDTEAHFLSEEADGERALFVLPGCRMDGSLVADMMRPQLRELGDTTFVDYPRRGFDYNEIRHGLLEARTHNPEKRATILALSMGGQVVSELFSDTEFRRSFGDVETILFDSSPADIGDVRASARAALRYADMLHGSWTFDKMGGWFMQYQTRRRIEHEVCISDEQLAHNMRTTAYAPLHMAHSQGSFIKKTRSAPGSLKNVAEKAYYVHSPYDSVINTDTAVAKFADAFDGALQDITDEQRPRGSHAASLAFQQKIVELARGEI